MEIKFQRKAINISKSDFQDLMDKSPLNFMISMIHSKEILNNTELGKKVERFEPEIIEEAKNLLNVSLKFNLKYSSNFSKIDLYLLNY